MRSRLRRAAVAGSLATVAEGLMMKLIPKLEHGREPVYLPQSMVRRMASRLGYTIDERTARRIGNAMRAGYGPAWGVGWALVRHGRIASPLRNACVLGPVIWAFELMVLPRVRATPPVRTWPRADVGWDLANCLVFAATYSGVIAVTDARRRGHGRDI